MPESNDEQIPGGVDPENYERLKNRVENLAKITWNANPGHLIDWNTLRFQASRKEDDSYEQRMRMLRTTYDVIVQEEAFIKAEQERLANETQEVWKYQFDLMQRETVQEFEVPKGATILTVKEHVSFNGQLSINIWMLVNPEAEKTPRKFQIVGTRDTVPKDAAYLGTTFFDKLVLHVWEISKL